MVYFSVTAFLDFVEGGEALTIIGEAHTLGIFFEDCHFVVKAQQVDEERAHLACT